MMILLFVGVVDGHVVSQIFVDTKELPGGWVLEIQFDAGYAKPEWREDFDKPQPDREWLVELSPEEQWELHQDAKGYLNEVLQVDGAESVFRFPDLGKTPPDFPVLRNGGAYFRIELDIDESNFELELSREAVPTFVIHRGGKYDSLKPGGVVAFGEIEVDGVSMERHAVSEGFLHVFPHGLDHTLFILAIFLYARRWKPLLWQSLSFTVAHTLTLGLTIGGVITPPSHWIEPLIALSIGALAVENFFAREKVGRKRLGLVFFFGLIHGMGFAGALAGTFGGDDFYIRLLLTNLGVELAQVAILSVAWLLTIRFNPRMRQGANLALIIVSLIWFGR
ncbi:HupE/UreJ family protein, partial [Akkermansiaceae bacterium]|nr:HupE/UreJ family protein [Akkermansiaceae bacterium]